MEVMDERQLSMTGIADLPDELLCTVFSFLTPQQICNHVSPVCTKWHQLSRDPSLWQSLTLEQCSFSTVVKLFRCAQLSHLKTLTVNTSSVRSSADGLFAFLSTQCSYLEHFNFPCAITVENLDALASSCRNLTRISINSITCERQDAAARKYNAFALLPRLQYLSLNMTMTHLEHASSLDACSELKVLDIRIDQTTENSMFRAFVDKHQRKLRKLTCDTNGLSDGSFAVLEKCSNLESFVLKLGERISDASLLSVVRQKTLRELRVINAHGLTSGGLVSLFAEHESLSHLLVLDLQWCRVLNGDDVAVAIANRCSQLRELCMDGCDVTDRGVNELVAKCSDLVELSLNVLRRLSTRCILTIPRSLPKLRKLSVLKRRNPSRTQAIRDQLTSAFPDLVVQV